MSIFKSLGRTYLYALDAGGQKGVEFVIDQLHQATNSTMALVGASNVSEIMRELVT